MGKVIPIIVMACDLAEYGAALGSESRARCREGVEVYASLCNAYPESIPVFVLAGGFSPDLHYICQDHSLAHMMRTELIQQGITESVIYADKTGWGSKQEIEVCFSEIQKLDLLDGVLTPDNDPDVVIVSSWYHLPRLRMLWDRLLKQKSAHLGICFDRQHPRTTFVSSSGVWPCGTLFEACKLPVQFVLG